MFDKIYRRLCGHPITTVDITAVLKIILTSYFSEKDNILHTGLKDRIFSDTDGPGLTIEAASAFVPNIAERRPAIIIRRGEWKNVQEGFYGGAIQDASINTYVRMIAGSHNIICIGKTPGEAEILGDEVFRLFAHITPKLLTNSCLDTFRVAGLSEVKPLHEGRDHYAAMIQVMYRFHETWEIEIEPVTTTTSEPVTTTTIEPTTTTSEP